MPNEIDSKLSGRYIYGIIPSVTGFQTTGIDGNPVYLIFYRDIAALVHSCHPKAYQSSNREQVENWLRQHQNVLDEALKHTNSLIPMSFDGIIDGSSISDPDDILKQWLQERYILIKDLLEQLSGCVEYGIKIYCSNEMLTAKVTKENPEIVGLKRSPYVNEQRDGISISKRVVSENPESGGGRVSNSRK